MSAALNFGWLPWEVDALDPDYITELDAAMSARNDVQSKSKRKRGGGGSIPGGNVTELDLSDIPVES